MEKYVFSNMKVWKSGRTKYCHTDFKPLLLKFEESGVITEQVDECIQKNQLCYPFFDIEWDTFDWWYSTVMPQEEVFKRAKEILRLYLSKLVPGFKDMYTATNFRFKKNKPRYSMHITVDSTRMYVRDIRKIAEDLKFALDEGIESFPCKSVDLYVYRAKETTFRLPWCWKFGETKNSVLLPDSDLEKFFVTR